MVIAPLAVVQYALVFERHDESLRLGARFGNERPEYVLIIDDPDAPQAIERFADPDTYRMTLVVRRPSRL